MRSRALLPLIALMFAPGCLPAWTRQAPVTAWGPDVLTAVAPGGAENVLYAVACEVAQLQAEKAAIEAASAELIRRVGARAAEVKKGPTVRVLRHLRPSETECWVLIELTLTPLP